MVQHKHVRKNYGGKLLVSIKYQNLHFKEGMIVLCQSILETRWISHLHGSALFTILLSYFDPWKSWKYKNVEGLGLILVADKKVYV